MKVYYCPLCGTKHTADKAETKTVCKCGKTLHVKVTSKATEVKILDVTQEDFDRFSDD